MTTFLTNHTFLLTGVNFLLLSIKPIFLSEPSFLEDMDLNEDSEIIAQPENPLNLTEFLDDIFPPKMDKNLEGVSDYNDQCVINSLDWDPDKLLEILTSLDTTEEQPPQSNKLEDLFPINAIDFMDDTQSIVSNSLGNYHYQTIAVNPPANTAMYDVDSTAELEYLIRSSGVVIDLKEYFPDANSEKHFKYFNKKYYRDQSIKDFFWVRYQTLFDNENKCYYIEFKQNAFDAIPGLNIINSKTRIKGDTALKHRLALLWLLFNNSPEIAFKIMNCPKCEDGMPNYVFLNTEIKVYCKCNNLKIHECHRNETVDEVYGGILKGLTLIRSTLGKVINFTRLFITLLRLHNYIKISCENERERLLNSYVDAGYVIVTEEGKFYHKVKWEFSDNNESKKKPKK